MAKDRTIKEVKEFLGDISQIIESIIEEKGNAKVLDAGCGYGIAMMGLIKRFGEKLEIVGYNYSRNDGTIDNMISMTMDNNIFSKSEIMKLNNMPLIHYLDASQSLPFSDNTFDTIYSVASIYLYDDKINFLKECNRILNSKGIARIHPSFGPHFKDDDNYPIEYNEFWEIWHEGKKIKLWDYINRITGVDVVRGDKTLGDKRSFIEIKKQDKLDFALEFVASIDMNIIWTGWGGIKSIYTTQKSNAFTPRYKCTNQYKID